jgi:MoxR-like ATPase
LHGQSTTDDLFGRFVPNTGQLTASLEDLLRCRGMLKPKTVALLEGARREGRPLTPVEAELVAAREALPLHQWIFQEGPIPQALRQGLMIVIDEANLSESQVLEGLNPVLELEPTLFLPGQGIFFGPTGNVRVHPGFRILATINPAGYAGRSPLSEAFRSRWTMTMAVPVPTEAEFRQMVLCVVFGEQPVVQYEGQKYQGISPALTETPPHAALAQVPGMRELLERVATLHAQVVQQSESKQGKCPTLGTYRRDPYAYTRRDLLTFLSLLEGRLKGEAGADLKLAALEALQQVYLARLDQDTDRQIVSDLLKAQGLDAKQWNLEAKSNGK